MAIKSCLPATKGVERNVVVIIRRIRMILGKNCCMRCSVCMLVSFVGICLGSSSVGSLTGQ